MRFTTKLLPSRSSNLGILELNHPKALHALTLDMVYALGDVLKEWHQDDNLKAILLTSTEGKRPTFCAGGDVKAVYEAGLDHPEQHGWGRPSLLTADFFRYEYQVNHAIASTNKPQVSIWDGVVMGGGVGLSVHGKYRVSTNHTLFAMPETAIGLFCDVGSTYWMPRILKGGLAPYVALTGKRLDASDLLYAGVATHYVPSDKVQDLKKALIEATLIEATDNNDKETDVVAPVLESFHEVPPTAPDDSFLAQHQQVIDEVFGSATRMEDIVANLKQLQGTPFGRHTLETLEQMSPTSMKITLAGLVRGGGQLSTVGECLQMEYRMAQACMRKESDFYRGIKSVLIDKNKDKKPEWDPPTLGEVTNAMVQEYFESLGENEWKIPPTEDASSPSKL